MNTRLFFLLIAVNLVFATQTYESAATSWKSIESRGQEYNECVETHLRIMSSDVAMEYPEASECIVTLQENILQDCLPEYTDIAQSAARREEMLACIEPRVEISYRCMETESLEDDDIEGVMEIVTREIDRITNPDLSDGCYNEE